MRHALTLDASQATFRDKMSPVAATHLHAYFNHLVREGAIPNDLGNPVTIDLTRVRTLIAFHAPVTAHGLTAQMLTTGTFTIPPPVASGFFTSAQAQARKDLEALRAPDLRAFAIALASSAQSPSDFPIVSTLRQVTSVLATCQPTFAVAPANP